MNRTAHYIYVHLFYIYPYITKTFLVTCLYNSIARFMTQVIFFLFHFNAGIIWILELFKRSLICVLIFTRMLLGRYNYFKITGALYNNNNILTSLILTKYSYPVPFLILIMDANPRKLNAVIQHESSHLMRFLLWIDDEKMSVLMLARLHSFRPALLVQVQLIVTQLW